MRTVEQAVGRWTGIFKYFGIDERTLSGNHCPCPVCGGKDRFRFDDKEGRGTFYCSHCGAGNGMDLLMKVSGMGFKDAATYVDGIVGTIQPAPKQQREQSNDSKIELCKRLWRESVPVTGEDPAHRYLMRRVGSDLSFDPGVIRYHPALGYRHEDKRVTTHPAMLAKVQSLDGSGTALWRTYLTGDGEKADLPSARKGIGAMPDGSAVRLSAHSGTLGIAEGIETALCAAKRFGVPVWSATSLNRLQAWIPPDEVRKVWIFGDNDVHGGGQIAAWRLFERLTKAGINAVVRIPDNAGTDWADVT